MDDNGGEWIQQTVEGNSFWYYYDSNGDMVTGWIKSDGYWYYCYGDGTMARDTMVHGYYVNNDGKWITDEGPREIIDGDDNHFSYYIGSHGKAVTGWNKTGDNLHLYYFPDGSMARNDTIDGFDIDSDGKISDGTGWLQDGITGKYYYYSNGSMQTGWVKYGDSWYYLKDDGSMATGWIESNGFWYYLQSDGSMAAEKWVNDGSGWYYLYDNGSMARGTTANGYYVEQEDGRMVTGPGWQHVDNKYFYLNSDDAVVTGWLEDKNNWYYLYPENSDSHYQGEMAENTTIDGWHVGDDGGWITGTGWKQNGNDWYYFDDSGKMLTNAWIPGNDDDSYYFVGSDGKMLKSTSMKVEEGKTIWFDSNGKAQTLDDGEAKEDYKADAVQIALTALIILTGYKVITKSAKGAVSNATYKEVNIHGNINTELDEVDLVNKIIYEDKSAGKLYMENPDFPQTEEQWALKQIFKKGSNRIDALQQEDFTLSSQVSSSLPQVDELKNIRDYVFRIDADTPELRVAVQEQLDKLKIKYPEFNFSATFGGK